MPVRKQDAHRALELLEDYHTRLTKPQDKQLKMAIERVIRIFKSRLFQALLDIQEFYECTLLDDSKSTQQKTLETLRIASKWEQEPPITNTQPKVDKTPASTDDELPPPPPELSENKQESRTEKTQAAMAPPPIAPKPTVPSIDDDDLPPPPILLTHLPLKDTFELF
ncbi:disks large 1 tumor suppressor protein-like [Argopecten irradians]|uniref:disks large 1 tumor suppressor protein-like n=1 Tax=Argopecten irradians TaxID=31199 RepID=UPI00372315FE